MEDAYDAKALKREGPSTRQDRGVMNELPFSGERTEHMSYSSVITALANRNVDLRGHSPNDISTIALIHANANEQILHCIRLPQDDGVEGTVSALERCKKSIRDNVHRAAEGLSQKGRVDLTRREKVHVWLEFSHRIEIDVPTFYLHLGRALHTLQDGFTHMVRTEDHHKVVSALNYIDTQETEHVPERDGHGHINAMDDCTKPGFRKTRAAFARRASAQLIRIAADTDESRRNRKLDDLFARYFAYKPGCDIDTETLCNARELRLESNDCRVQRRAPSFVWLLAFFAALGWRRRGPKKRAVQSAVLASFLCCVLPSAASAQQFGGLARVGGALDKGALSVSGGPLIETSENWIIGLVIDFNPWVSFGNSTIKPGSLNISVNVTRRFAVADEFALRTGGSLGISILLFDLAGAEQWDVGPYLGISPLSAEIYLSDDTSLLLEPSDIAVPIPHLGGIPIAYPQYRWSVGMQFFGRE